METKYATAVVLEDLPLYWDPRYKRYFYRGVMPSPTGTPALEALYAAPMIDVVISEDTPAATPIFVGRDADGSKSRPSSGNRVRWMPGIPSPQRKVAEEVEEWNMPMSLFVFTMIVLGLLIFLAILILWIILSDDKDTSETSTWEGEDEGIDDFGLLNRPFRGPPSS
ncbi:hypothetical protein MRX96_059769 [Rhipicephalus microplus]